MRLESLELGAFLRWRTTLDSRRGDLYRGGWVGEYADPANWYNALWDSRADAAQLNSGWRSGTFDALVRRAAVEDDRAARAALYAEAEALLAEDYPAIPLYQTARRALRRTVPPYGSASTALNTRLMSASRTLCGQPSMIASPTTSTRMSI